MAHPFRVKVLDSYPARALSVLGRRFPCLIGLSAMLTIAALIGDAVLPPLAHLLHLAIEIIELPLEHLLELAFHLSPRQSQGVLAWSALIALIYLAVRFIRSTGREVQDAYSGLTASLHRLRTRFPALLKRPAATLTLTVGVLSALVFVMF